MIRSRRLCCTPAVMQTVCGQVGNNRPYSLLLRVFRLAARYLSTYRTRQGLRLGPASTAVACWVVRAFAHIFSFISTHHPTYCIRLCLRTLSFLFFPPTKLRSRVTKQALFPPRHYQYDACLHFNAIKPHQPFPPSSTPPIELRLPTPPGAAASS